MALSWLDLITDLTNSLAASCSKRKRSRMLLLVSIRMAMRSGRSVSAVNSAIVLRLLVFEDLEIVLAEVGDEAALLVGDGEQHVDARHVDLNAGGLVGLRDGDGLGRILGPEGESKRTHGGYNRPEFHMCQL